jgi:hypothetical protein
MILTVQERTVAFRSPLRTSYGRACTNARCSTSACRATTT